MLNFNFELILNFINSNLTKKLFGNIVSSRGHLITYNKLEEFG